MTLEELANRLHTYALHQARTAQRGKWLENRLRAEGRAQAYRLALSYVRKAIRERKQEV